MYNVCACIHTCASYLSHSHNGIKSSISMTYHVVRKFGGNNVKADGWRFGKKFGK